MILMKTDLMVTINVYLIHAKDLEDPTMRALSDLQDQDIEAREPP